MEADHFIACVQAGDTARLTRLPGVGKRTAERLVVEMRDRLADWGEVQQAVAAATAEGNATGGDAVSDAVSALIALGYKPNEASRYVHAVAAEDMNSEAIIREALKGIARSAAG
jgi:Holliday junction DNA helicase RuvA